MAETAAPLSSPLHPDQFFLAEHARALFRDLTQNRLKRGVFRSVVELIAALDAYIDAHNEKPKPFIWTAQARDVLAEVIRAQETLNFHSA